MRLQRLPKQKLHKSSWILCSWKVHCWTRTKLQQFQVKLTRLIEEETLAATWSPIKKEGCSKSLRAQALYSKCHAGSLKGHQQIDPYSFFTAIYSLIYSLYHNLSFVVQTNGKTLRGAKNIRMNVVFFCKHKGINVLGKSILQVINDNIIH